MSKYEIYAYAHMDDTRVIRIYSIGDFHRRISLDTKVESGVITGLKTVFESIKKPFPFVFVWLPDKHIKANFTNSVAPGAGFSLDMRIIIRADDNVSSQGGFNFTFAQCKMGKSHSSGKKVKVEATCNWFRADP